MVLIKKILTIFKGELKLKRKKKKHEERVVP